MNDNDKKILASDIKNNVKKTNWFLVGLAASMVGLSVFGISQAAHAEGEVTVNDDYIGELKTKLGGVDDAGGIVYKVAAGTIAFGAGAKIVKRTIYA